MNKLNVNCNICNSDEFDTIYPEGKAQIHRIVKCRNCGLLYANPQTTHRVSGKASLIPDEEESTAQVEQELKDFTPEKDAYLRKQYIQERDYASVLSYYDKRSGTLLDIGSFAGVFLNAAKQRGWDVLGIEPATVPRIYSERQFGLKVLSAPFESCSLGEETIDAIVSFHVIEHVYNPREFILRAHRVLKPNGVLVLETPTYDSYVYRLFRHRERSLRCNGHIYFFTQETLRKLVESCGFRVTKHETVGRTLSMDRLFYNLGLMTGFKKSFERLARLLGADGTILHINMKDMQRIYCEKVS